MIDTRHSEELSADLGSDHVMLLGSQQKFQLVSLLIAEFKFVSLSEG